MQPNNLAKEVRKLLPGTDCTGRGGCGFATCDECAAAIAEGGPANLCPACKEEDIAAIVALTGGELVPARQETAFIKCSGCAAGKSRLKVYGSCEEAVKSGFAEHECVYGCVGAGSCVAACTFGGPVYCGWQCPGGQGKVQRLRRLRQRLCTEPDPHGAVRCLQLRPLFQSGRGGACHPPVRLQLHWLWRLRGGLSRGRHLRGGQLRPDRLRQVCRLRGLHRLLPEEDHCGHLS